MQPVSYAPGGSSGTHGHRTISATAAMIAIAMQQQRMGGGHAGIIQAAAWRGTHGSTLQTNIQQQQHLYYHTLRRFVFVQDPASEPRRVIF